MAHGVSEILGERNKVFSIKKQKRMQQQGVKKNVGVMGSRRIFSPAFKLKVLESYRNDMDCRGNQRATARKYGIHRRQIQKWLQCEENLRNCLADGNNVGIGKSVTRSSPKPPKDYVVVEKRHHHQQQQVQPQPPQQQQQQQQHQMHNGAGAPPPALNLCVARQHGDELLQQQQDQQRPPPPSPQQSPPLPPPPSTSSSSNSSSSSIVAAQALAAAAAAAAAASQHQTDYRFHSNAVTVLPPQATTAAQTGYLELQNKIVRMPPYTNAQMMDLYQARAIAGFSDPTLVTGCYRRHSAAIVPQEINRYAELQYYRRSSSPRYHEIPSPMQQEMSPVTLLSPTQIKIERASPDSRTTPGSVDAIPSAYSSATTATGTTTTTTDSIRARSLPSPHIDFIPKKEQLTEIEYRHEKISAISPERLLNRNTPPVTPYYNMSCLPLSPGDSDEPCSTEASDIETDQQTNDTHVVQRKSYPVRFKLEVLNAFRFDNDIRGNQRATARKYNICRRQVQKWLIQEANLRQIYKATGNGDRQRLGPFTEPVSEETPVDLRTSHPSIPMMLAATTTTELGQISPRSTNSAGPCSCCDYRTATASSPLNYAIESSLTPPYSAPGCSLSCCPDVPAPGSVGSNYYCYSPPEIDSHNVAPVHESSLKRSTCTQSCCITDEPASKRPHLDDKSDVEEGQEQPIQESPLCLVKPKHEEPASPSTKVTKDPILFKPYLDNPVRKPNNRSSPVISNGNSNNNNNNSSTCNYNVGSGNVGQMELQMSFKLPASQQPQDQQQHLQQQQQQPQPNAEQYLGYAEARSAFVRYPSNGHYS